jgi:ABC-type transport system involved in multi-copper enzyme maturation permease subunit
MRWGPGPVFIYECLANSRRWQTYALRSVGVAVLLSAMATIAMASVQAAGSSARDYATLGQAYFIAMIGVELALVMLAAPAATAGAICVDRARGTLAHMLMTDLSDAEIVLGKLAARLLPVFGLVACTWPVMAISSLLGGIDPIALTLAYAIIVAVAVLGCTIALTLSVWARKSHEVILATYTVFILGLLLWPIWYLLLMGGWAGPPPAWALITNPFYVAFAPYAAPGTLDVWDYLVFFGVALGASVLLVVLAVWRTRPVACRGSVEKSKGPRIGLIGRTTRWIPGPSLDRNPVLWREWHRTRPSRWMTSIVLLLMGTTGALCIVGAGVFWKNGVVLNGRSFWEIAGVSAYLLHVIFGLLMLSAIAPTSMTEERQRGSLDMIAATALSTQAIVIGKWLGTFRLVVFMTIGPGLIVLAMATCHSNARFAYPAGLHPDYYRILSRGARIYVAVVAIATMLAHGALITSVGLALAVWIKRQSRAIALSIGFFILVTAAWPILVSIPFQPHPGRDLAILSPVVACTIFISFLASRAYAAVGSGLGWCTFWAVEVFVLAMGILWLTVRTFDACVGRIPERPHRNSVWAGVVMIMAGMIGAGSLVGAIDSWIEGVKPGWLGGPSSIGVTAYSFLIAIGLVLVAIESAQSGRPVWPAISEVTPDKAARESILDRWRLAFRLVLLLAIGPALLATALATARSATQYEPQLTTDSAGAQTVTSYVLVRSDIPYPGEVRLGQRLMIAAALVVTILVHGGAAISVGLALTTANAWLRRAMVTVVGFTILGILAMRSLLIPLVSRTWFSVAETLRTVMFWNVVVTLFAAALVWCTIWIWKRRLSGERPATIDYGYQLGLVRTAPPGNMPR